MRKNGFTLIELLAVIIILAVILTITIPLLLKVIKNSKNTVKKDSLELYGRSIENALASYYTKYPGKNEVTLQELKQEKLLDYKGKEITCETVEIYERDVYLANCKVGNNPISTTYGKPIFASTNKDYSGYYADIDGDGTVDGIIYADLAHKKEETTWGDSNGTYSYEAKTNLNEYIVSNNTYKKNDGFGENKIIKLKKDKNNPRFYVMALEDFRTGSFEEGNSQGYTEGTYYWYYNAAGKMPNLAKDTSEGFGTGYENTGTMIKIWNNKGVEDGWNHLGATQDDHDIWKHIQTKYQEGWYIPSKEEWSAFADYLAHKEDNPLTTNNYNSAYELSSWYWSSSASSENSAWVARFIIGSMKRNYVSDDYCMRLGATF